VDEKFWLNRWQDNAIPFHRAETNHYLMKYFHRLALGRGDEVLVPLCGKSVDMRWLAGRGCRVIGVELSEIAVRDFFREQRITAAERRDGAFLILEGEGVALLCGDFFALEKAHAERVAAVYDRAALIALPAGMRERYAEHLLSLLAPRVPILLLTFEYPADEMDGPPFSVGEAEVRRLFSAKRRVTCLETLDRLAEEPRLAERGATRLEEHAFLLTDA
jgi:thiopurine S-methyltransferase